MSVRAYRIINIEYDRESFNLWHDKNITDWLDKHIWRKDQDSGFWSQLDDDGCGTVEIEISLLEKMLNELKDISSYTKDAIKIDIEETKKEGDNYIVYGCN